MSTRRTARTADERVAALEEWVRRLQGDKAGAPTDPRFLYSARGQILVAAGEADPIPLSPGTVGDWLTMGVTGLPQWEAPDRIRLSSVAVKGTVFVGGASGGVVALSPGPDGQVLTADSTETTVGVRWA